MLNRSKPILIILIALSMLVLSSCRSVPPSITETDGSANENTSAPPLDLDPDSRPRFTPGREALKEETGIAVKLHYLTDDGYMVPYKKYIEKQPGIARACLNLLIPGGEDQNELLRLGLNAPLPYGTEFTISIIDGEARVNLDMEAPVTSEKQARDIVAAVVNTLVGFATIDTVSISINGDKEIKNIGVYLPEKTEAIPMNIEDGAMMTAGNTHILTLYFPNRSSGIYVPVTRYVSEKPNIYRIVSALNQGTKFDGLMGIFPEGTLVLGAAEENGVLTVNLSKEFYEIEKRPGMYDVAMQSVLLSCMPYAKIDEIRFTVNGELFEP